MINPDQLIRVRMAPSPTGFLHIGGARTAVFNYLFAKRYGGKFILRIEDTDKERSKQEFTDAILKDLEWLGIPWDEGPYFQSHRNALYEKYHRKLIEKDKVYACYCTMEELEQERKELLADKQIPRYMGKCRKLTQEQQKKLEVSGRDKVYRFRIDETDIIEVNDLIRGSIKVDPQILGDFVILKSDGGPVYNFAVVVDDYEMKISHVIRGEEHISNTPRQILLARALDIEPPYFAHVSIILAPDRTKLSKRHGAVSVGEYREQGYLADALFNYLSLLGWNPGDEREVMGRDEIIKSFVLERVIKSPAIFDVQKLAWMNGIYIRTKTLPEIMPIALEHLKKAGYPVESKDPQWLKLVVEAIRGNLEKLDQIGKFVEIFFDETFSFTTEAKEILLSKKEDATLVLEKFKALLLESPELNQDQFINIQQMLKKTVSVSPKVLFQTQRLALTGRLNGPEMNLVAPILGVKTCLKRIASALQLFI